MWICGIDRFYATDELSKSKICGLSFRSSIIKTDNRRIMRHNFLRLAFVVFDELNVHTNNLSIARFYTGKFDRRNKRRT